MKISQVCSQIWLMRPLILTPFTWYDTRTISRHVELDLSGAQESQQNYVSTPPRRCKLLGARHPAPASCSVGSSVSKDIQTKEPMETMTASCDILDHQVPGYAIVSMLIWFLIGAHDVEL